MMEMMSLVVMLRVMKTDIAIWILLDQVLVWCVSLTWKYSCSPKIPIHPIASPFFNMDLLAIAIVLFKSIMVFLSTQNFLGRSLFLF